MKYTPSQLRQIDTLAAEHLAGYKWYRSNLTGKRCIYSPQGYVPEWMDSPADGTEPLVGDWERIHIPEFTLSLDVAFVPFGKAFELGYYPELFNDSVLWVAVLRHADKPQTKLFASDLNPATAITLVMLKAAGVEVDSILTEKVTI